jgi:hypothetical protein
MGNCIFGTIVYKTDEKIRHNIITTKKPKKIPKLNIMPFLKPTFLALFMDIMLFGPGVYATMIIYDRNEIQGNIRIPHNLLCQKQRNVSNSSYNNLYFSFCGVAA